MDPQAREGEEERQYLKVDGRKIIPVGEERKRERRRGLGEPRGERNRKKIQPKKRKREIAFSLSLSLSIRELFSEGGRELIVWSLFPPLLLFPSFPFP